MSKAGLFFKLFLLCLLGLTGGQENVEFNTLYGTTPEVLQVMSHTGHALAVFVSDDLSFSVLRAETWLRTHVLAHFPAAKITNIVVGDKLLCQDGQDHNLVLLLPSLKNLYHSLTRWGLEREIKISVSFSSNCFDPESTLFRGDSFEKVTKPLLEFLQRTNSTYSIHLPRKLSPLSDESKNLINSHTKFVKKIGLLALNKINVVVTNPTHQTHVNRKLTTTDSKIEYPYPTKPNPLPETSQPPLHSSAGYSVPANIAKRPHAPLTHAPLTHIASPPPLSFPVASPPSMHLPFAPQQPPATTPPHAYSLPPCNPAYAMPPAPDTGGMQRLWCVAKPSVPAETLQEAMDYACGQGGADCSDIQPHGSCFYPDTVLAHASYAFNSYWQRTKKNGGSCSFGGTAMIINADPSFLHCRFVLS